MSDHPAERVLAALHDPTAWLITDEAHAQLVEIASRDHDPAAAAQYRAAAGSRAMSSRSGAGGRTAVLEITGPLVRRASLFSDVSGLTSTDALSDEFAALDADPSVDRIILRADSPGGQVSGIAEFAARVRDATTPTIAHVSDMAASAAYWVASQADEVTTTATGVLGSIGVIGRAPGKPDPDDVVSRGAPNKRGSRDAVQSAVDALERELHESVAAGRGVTAEHVAENFGKGGLFIGRDAVAAGLADRVTTFDALLAEGSTPATPAPQAEETPMPPEKDPKDGSSAADATAIAAAKEEGRLAGKAEAEASASEQATTTERERVSAVMKAGAGKPAANVQFAIDQGMSVEAATEMFATVADAAPPKAEGGVLGLGAGMDAHGHPRIAPGAEGGQNDDPEAAAATSAYLAGADAALKEAG